MKKSRYNQVSVEQKKILLSESEPVIVPGLRSYVGQYSDEFEKARLVLEREVAGLATGDYWRYAFAKYCSSSEVAEPSNYLKAAYNFANGFCRWIHQSGRDQMEILALDTEAMREYYEFLPELKNKRGKNKGEPLNPNTLRKYYGILKSFVEILLQNKNYAANMAKGIRFIANPFPDAQTSTKSVEVLDDDTFIRLYATVRELCEKTMEEVEQANVILSGPRIPPNEHARGRGQYNELGALLEPGVLSKRSGSASHLCDACGTMRAQHRA